VGVQGRFNEFGASISFGEKYSAALSIDRVILKNMVDLFSIKK
jgi:hypothetical protein